MSAKVVSMATRSTALTANVGGSVELLDDRRIDRLIAEGTVDTMVAAQCDSCPEIDADRPGHQSVMDIECRFARDTRVAASTGSHTYVLAPTGARSVRAHCFN